MFLNEVFIKIKGKLVNSLKLSTDFTRWLTAEFTGSLSKEQNRTRPDTKITTQNHEFGLLCHPADGHTISCRGVVQTN